MRFLLFFIFNSINVFGAENSPQSPTPLMNISIEVAKLEYRSEGEEMELDYTFSIDNHDKKIKEIRLDYDYSYDKVADFFEGDHQEQVSKTLRFQFDLNRLFYKGFGYTSYYSLQQTKENDRYLIKYRGSIAPIGIKYAFTNNDGENVFTISYLPSYFYLERDDNSDDGTSVVSVIERYSEQIFRFEFNFDFLEDKFNISNDFMYSQLNAYDENASDQNYFTYTNTLSLKYALNQHFEIGYTNTYTYDDSRKDDQGVSPVGQSSIFNIKLTWQY
jgi:hypothetical protein